MIFMLAINGVTKRYGKTIALNQVSLIIPSGSCYGLVGPNGAGKSTLLKILASVIQSYQGDIRLEGSNEKHISKNQVGYVPQELCLEQNLSAYSNLRFFGGLYGLKGKELQIRTKEVLSEIGLTERSKEKVVKFSGGMKRRLNIGCALMHQPELIIMDEPTVGIDPQSRHYIFKMIQRLKQRGCTIIYASHYMEEVEQLCDAVALIDHGKIMEQGEIDDLLQKHATPSVFVKGDVQLPKDIKDIGDIANRNGGYLVTTEKPLLVMDKMLTYYHDMPERLERLELVQPRLEDVFLSLTGSQLRDGRTTQKQEEANAKRRIIG